MKGNTDCHIPNDKYRNNYDNIFGKKTKMEERKSDSFETKELKKQKGTNRIERGGINKTMSLNKKQTTEELKWI